MLYLKSQIILAVGTIRLNHLGGYSMDDNKSLWKSGRDSMDYRTDNNSDIIMVEWVDNSVVQLSPIFVASNQWVKYQVGVRKTKFTKIYHVQQL